MTNPAVRTGSATGAGPLLEREHELSALDGLLGRGDPGSSGLVVVEGPAGIGKSRLIAELRERAAGAGARVLAGARATLPGDICFVGLGVVHDQQPVAAVEASLEAVEGALLPHRAGFYPNFVEEPADASAFFDPATWARLREVKALYDPQDLFRGNHHVPPASRAELAA
jgi:hypothetical protein